MLRKQGGFRESLAVDQNRYFVACLPR